MPGTDVKDKPLKESPHYVGHRQRLRERFLIGGPQTLADYEILEMLLFAARPQGDVKPLAKSLLAQFGGLAKVLMADPLVLMEKGQLSETAVAALKIVQAASERMLKEQCLERPIIQSWTALLDYCRLHIGHKNVEEFHVLFLNHRYSLIADELLQRGTTNQAAVYPREVVKRALERGATNIILVHNHPTGDISPSKADIDITKQIVAAGEPLEIKVIDHLIVSSQSHYSFKSHGLL